MKMKNIFSKIATVAVIALALAATTSCNNKKFRVEGNIANAKDSTLYFENVGLDGPQIIDSVKLTSDGNFTFAEKANCSS
jgi:hypothetical protein